MFKSTLSYSLQLFHMCLQHFYATTQKCCKPASKLKEDDFKYTANSSIWGIKIIESCNKVAFELRDLQIVPHL